eukprot:m.17214 g.17214  ORF g.17214 m.17214 type:complete len:1110 (+) comp27381_c0_seq2:299-3628(+)
MLESESALSTKVLLKIGFTVVVLVLLSFYFRKWFQSEGPPALTSQRVRLERDNVKLDECSQQELEDILHPLVASKWQLFAEHLNFSMRAILEIESEMSKTSASPPTAFLAKFLQEEKVSVVEAVRSAYLVGEKKVARKLLQLHGDFADFEDDLPLEHLIIRKLSNLLENWSDLQWNTLRGIFELPCPDGFNWHDLLNALNVKGKIQTTEEKMRSLFDWGFENSKPCQTLLTKLSDVGHTRAVQELIGGLFLRSKARRSSYKEMDVTKQQKIGKQFPKLFDVPVNKFDLKGRKEELAKLEANLQKNGTALVCGPPGIGKTSLVTKLVDKIQEQYKYIWFISCSSEDGFQHSITTMGKQYAPWLQADAPRGGLHFKESFESTRTWVHKNGEKDEILLVFDGLRGSETKSSKTYTVERFLDSRLPSKVHCVFTSQETLFKVGGVHISEPLELSPFTEEEVTKILIELSDHRIPPNLDDVRAIARYIGGIPLFVDLVANYIKTEKATFKAYKNWIDVERGLVLHEGQRRESLKSYNWCLDKAMSKPEVKEMLSILALCDIPNPIPMDLFSLGISGLKEDTHLGRLLMPKQSDNRSSAILPRQVHQVLTELARFHLISLRSKTGESELTEIVMHSEIGRLVREDDAVLEKQAILESLLTAAFQAFRTVNIPCYEALLPHAAKLIRDRMPNPYLMVSFGRIYSFLGHFIDGEEILAKALTLVQEDRQLLNSELHAKVLHYLGEVKRRKGLLSEAEELIYQSKKLWSGMAHFASKRPLKEEMERELAAVQTGYAEVFLDIGDYQKTLTLLEESETLERLRDEADSPRASPLVDEVMVSHDRGSIYCVIGRTYQGLGQFRDAQEWFERGLIILKDENEYRFVFTRARLKSSKTWWKLASDLEEFSAALCQTIVCMEEVESKYGLNHRFTAWIKREVASFLVCRADGEESADRSSTLHDALQLARQSLTITSQTSGKRHQRVAKVCQVIAEICSKLAFVDNSPKAIACTKLALEIAIAIWKSLKSSKFPIINSKIDGLEKELDEADQIERSHCHVNTTEYAFTSRPVAVGASSGFQHGGMLQAEPCPDLLELLEKELWRLKVTEKSNSNRTWAAYGCY